MRKKWAKTSAKVALLTAGFVVIGSGAGYAGEITHGDFGAGSGNQLHVPASAPINASGNAGSVLGQARSLSESGAHVHNNGSENMLTSGRFAFIGGNQGYVPLSAPINASGNAGTLGGQAWAASKSAATVVNGHHDHAYGDEDASPSAMSRVTRPVTDTARQATPQAAQQAPASAASPLSSVPSLQSATSSLPSPLSSITDATKTVPGGGLPTTGALGGGSPLSKLPLKKKQHMAAQSSSDGGGTMLSSGDFGVLSGNQAYVPVSAPVNACGNAISALGQAMAACKGGATVHNAGGNQLSSGKFGVLGGNQLNAPLSAPVNFCGNSAAGAGQALAKCKGLATVTNGHTHRVWSPEQSMPEAPAPAPQQGPAEPAPAPKPAPKPNLPKPNLPKLPIGVQKPDCGCAPMAKTPQVPSVGLPKPQVSLPKVQKPSVEVPKPQLPKAHVPMPTAPKADVPLPAPQQDCGCAPAEAQKADAPTGTRVTSGDATGLRDTAGSVRDTAGSLRDSMIGGNADHLKKKSTTVGTPGDEATRNVDSVLQGQNAPVSATGLADQVVK